METARQILTDKEVLTVGDVMVIFSNSVKEIKAYDIIKTVNHTSNSTIALRGKCFTTDFIKHFNLNPADYGRA